MNQQKYISSKLIVFSKWSRKNYTVFSSLGKQVKIGVLKARICQKTLLKGLVDIITISKNTEDFEEEESKVNIADTSYLQFAFSTFGLLLFLFFNLASVTSSQENRKQKNIIQHIHSLFFTSVESRLFLCNKI